MTPPKLPRWQSSVNPKISSRPKTAPKKQRIIVNESSESSPEISKLRVSSAKIVPVSRLFEKPTTEEILPILDTKGVISRPSTSKKVSIMIPNGGDIIEEYNELIPLKEDAIWHNNIEDTEDKDVSIADEVSDIQIEYNQIETAENTVDPIAYETKQNQSKLSIEDGLYSLQNGGGNDAIGLGSELKQNIVLPKEPSNQIIENPIIEKDTEITGQDSPPDDMKYQENKNQTNRITAHKTQVLENGILKTKYTLSIEDPIATEDSIFSSAHSSDSDEIEKASTVSKLPKFAHFKDKYSQDANGLYKSYKSKSKKSHKKASDLKELSTSNNNTKHAERYLQKHLLLDNCSTDLQDSFSIKEEISEHGIASSSDECNDGKKTDKRTKTLAKTTKKTIYKENYSSDMNNDSNFTEFTAGKLKGLKSRDIPEMKRKSKNEPIIKVEGISLSSLEDVKYVTSKTETSIEHSKSTVEESVPIPPKIRRNSSNWNKIKSLINKPKQKLSEVVSRVERIAKHDKSQKTKNKKAITPKSREIIISNSEDSIQYRIHKAKSSDDSSDSSSGSFFESEDDTPAILTPLPTPSNNQKDLDNLNGLPPLKPIKNQKNPMTAMRSSMYNLFSSTTGPFRGPGDAHYKFILGGKSIRQSAKKYEQIKCAEVDTGRLDKYLVYSGNNRFAALTWNTKAVQSVRDKYKIKVREDLQKKVFELEKTRAYIITTMESLKSFQSLLNSL
jgi:hypothetical protein